MSILIIKINTIYNYYKYYLPSVFVRKKLYVCFQALFRALGMCDNDFRFGVSKVFFRPGKFAEFDAVMRSDPENLAQMVAKVKKWLLASRWKKAQWCALSVIKC